MKISPYCWTKSLADHSVVSLRSHLPQLGVEPGTLGSEGRSLHALVNHLWEYKVCFQRCWTKCADTVRHLSSVSWLWTCGAGVSRRALSSLLGRKTEEDRHSTDRLAADSPRPLAFISNLCHLSSSLVRGWPRLQKQRRLLAIHWPSPSQLYWWQASSRTSWHHCRWTIRNTSCFAVSDRILVHSVGSNKQGCEESDQECQDEVKATLEYSSSLYGRRQSCWPGGR